MCSPLKPSSLGHRGALPWWPISGHLEPEGQVPGHSNFGSDTGGQYPLQKAPQGLVSTCLLQSSGLNPPLSPLSQRTPTGTVNNPQQLAWDSQSADFCLQGEWRAVWAQVHSIIHLFVLQRAHVPLVLPLLQAGAGHTLGGLVTSDTGPACFEVQPLLSWSLWFQTQGGHGTHRNV